MVRPTRTELRLPEIADYLLTTAAAAFGDGAPTRRYRAAGYAAQDLAACDDCDSQLTVCMTQSTPSGPGGRGAGIPTPTPHMLRSWLFTVELARSVPTVTDDLGAPSPDVLDASAAQHLADYRTLDLWARSLGFDSKTDDQLRALGVGQIAPSSLSTVGPLGGVVALRAVVAVNA